MNPNTFAQAWADAWNRRDVEAVLSHFVDDVRFTSPTAFVVTGNAVVQGKPALRAYWLAALAKVDTIHFTVDRVLWEASRRELAIIYVERVNGASRMVSENLILDDAGRVTRAEVFHGAHLAPG
jgi:hypothetical protein